MGDLSTREFQDKQPDPVDTLIHNLGEYFHDPYNKVSGSTLKKYLLSCNISTKEYCSSVYWYCVENFERKYKVAPGIKELKAAVNHVAERQEEKHDHLMLDYEPSEDGKLLMSLLSQALAEGRNPKNDPRINEILKGI